MSMVVQVSINNIEIERFVLQRREPFLSDELVYTYDVTYRRQQEHRSASLQAAAVVVRHKFSDGSLVLLQKMLSELAAEKG